jgi:hypothetical protein
MPLSFLDLGNGKYHYNYNVKEVEGEPGNATPLFCYDTVEIAGQPSYSRVVSAVLRERYSADEETALINNYNNYQLAVKADKRDKDKNNYVAYLEDRRAIKEIVKQDCINNNIPLE